MKSHANNSIPRPARITAIVVLMASTLAGSSAVGQPERSQPDVKQIPSYISDLGEANPRVREKAADMLGIMGLDIKDETVLLPAVARLVPLMGDGDMEVRDETAEALGVIGSCIKDEAAVNAAIAALIQGLSDKSGEVRGESAEALGRIASTIKDKTLLDPTVGPLARALKGDLATKEFAEQALALLGRTVPRASQPNKQAAPNMRRERYLLLDSRIIESTESAKLTVGAVRKDKNNPLFREDKPWEPRFDNLYANVIYEEQEKLYKCWYSPFIVDKAVSGTPREKRTEVRYRPRGREMGICCAVSRDGLKWEKPDLGLVTFEGSTANNLVLRGPHGAGIFKDPRDPDPQRRYKMFYQGMAVRFSVDGLRWREAVPCRGIEARGDTHNNAFWAPKLGKYVGITRLWKGQRIVGRTESPDFVRWTKAVEVLRGDPQNQTYAMPVFRYADVYLGLLMILRRGEDRVHCELTWSPDTIRWNRIDPGTPLIPNSPTRGDCDWGCVYAANDPVILDDEIRIYYGGSNGPHGGWRDGFLCLATLRPDGWAGYEPVDSDRPGIVVTRPVVLPAGPLRVTADAADGSVQVALVAPNGKTLGHGKPITENVTGAVVSFNDKDVLANARGQPVRVKFEMHNAKLFSFAFSQ